MTQEEADYADDPHPGYPPPGQAPGAVAGLLGFVCLALSLVLLLAAVAFTMGYHR